ncbi:flavin monoamine oxidase family protein [Actinophytocola xinjiangensis]|uniref:flavin monoamine oxidase family protein n=1 Tax=Actinophytocola xinjiangensis TaxID=485602 RepID=UPI000A9022EA|nr:FAD-dependent oxidoreductase [Actinophytocola xinjiangensis]
MSTVDKPAGNAGVESGTRLPSRRRFLSVIGAATAGSALLQSMTGAIPATAAPAGQFRQGRGGARQAGTVLIIGAGVAGLRAARLLLDQGYSVEISEALDRPGGRNFTARTGDKVVENGSGGTITTQTCTFDEGLYLNLGAGRIPYHHRRVLDLCSRLEVLLEPYIMETTANRFAAVGGVAETNRRVANDTRGHLAALLHRAVKKGALTAELAALSSSQQENLLDLLTVFGDLNTTKDFEYTGSTRAGNKVPLSVTDMPQAPTPLGLGDLIDARYWQNQFYHPVNHLWQATMFQPVGGMDMIVKALVGDLPEGTITYDDPVTSVEILPDGVLVKSAKGGERTVDYCLSNMPLPVLHEKVLKGGFSSDFQKAVGILKFGPSCKVGWQANERFWESDKYQIYGGISWTNDIIQQVWYPSNDYFSEKGTMTGAYNFDDDAIKMGEMSLAERLDTARQSATRLHTEFGDTDIVPNNGLSIAWHKVPYQSGVSAHWDPADVNSAFAYSRLLAPDTPTNRRFFVIGDQVSPLPGWQEGALMSAEYVVGQLTGTQRSEPPVVHQVPDSRALRP